MDNVMPFSELKLCGAFQEYVQRRHTSKDKLMMPWLRLLATNLHVIDTHEKNDSTINGTCDKSGSLWLLVHLCYMYR